MATNTTITLLKRLRTYCNSEFGGTQLYTITDMLERICEVRYPLNVHKAYFVYGHESMTVVERYKHEIADNCSNEKADVNVSVRDSVKVFFRGPSAFLPDMRQHYWPVREVSAHDAHMYISMYVCKCARTPRYRQMTS
jgi:hypothetical protein